MHRACGIAHASSSNRDVHGPWFGAKIEGISFRVPSAEDIVRSSAVRISDNAIAVKNVPKNNGPNSAYMGTCDRRIRCITCKNEWFNCTGHHGHIELPLAFYNPIYIDMNKKMLEALCWWCCKLRGPDREFEVEHTEERYNTVCMQMFTSTVAKNRGKFTCTHCRMPQPKKYTRKKKYTYLTRVWKTESLDKIEKLFPEAYEFATCMFTPTHVYHIFERIPEHHIRALGLDPTISHPKNMLMHALYVLPPCCRPAISATEGSKRKGQDDLTVQLQDILKHLKQLYVEMHCSLTGSCKRAKPASKRASMKMAANKEKLSQMMISSSDTKQRTTHLVPNPAKVFPEEFSDSYRFLPFMIHEHEHGLTCFELEAITLMDEKFVPRLDLLQAIHVWTQFTVKCMHVQHAITNLIDNSDKYAPQTKQRSGQPKKSLMTRYQGKANRIRGNMTGKRTMFNARGVIAPSTSNDIDELGVPSVIMDKLTLPEMVNARNFARLKNAVERGEGVMGGASRLIKTNGEVVQLDTRLDRSYIDVDPGDIVERHLIDGDVVLFNRQPSLHRPSMMAHKARRVEGNVFRMSLGVFGPYNADCDGDEMNLHVVQGEMPTSDAVNLMSIDKNVINPQNNLPCFALVQDACVGVFMMTRESTSMDEDLAWKCFGAIRHRLPGKELFPPPDNPDGTWSGKAIFSLLLPFVNLENDTCRIRGGVLTKGPLAKRDTAALINRIQREYGGRMVIQFISDAQRVSYMWLRLRGMTCGFRDCATNGAIDTKMRAFSDAVCHKVTNHSSAFATLEQFLLDSEKNRFEALLITTLMFVLDYGSRLVLKNEEDEDDLQNDGAMGFRSMVMSGSKGNKNNLTWVKECIGQQIIDGERVVPDPSCARTFTMFKQGAKEPESRGFVPDSYFSGLASPGMFSHMMASRAGLLSTAKGTAETGYAQRSIIKGMETNVVSWDLSVRNGSDRIIQFVYGSDGMDPTRLERVGVKFLRMDREMFVNSLGLVGNCEEYLEEISYLWQTLRKALMVPTMSLMSGTILTPVHVAYKLDYHRSRHGDPPPIDMDARVCGRYCSALLDLCRSVLSVYPPFVAHEATVALRLLILYELRPAALASAGIEPEVLENEICKNVLSSIIAGFAANGEACGVLAGQSIGAPSTQLTLNAFHTSGLKRTDGMPRLKEILHATQNMAMSVMHARFARGIDGATMERLVASLPYTKICDIVESSYIVDTTSDSDFADEGVKTSAAHVRDMFDLPSPSKWCARFVLNKTTCERMCIAPVDVASKIFKTLEKQEIGICIEYTVDLADAKWVMRAMSTKETDETYARYVHTTIMNIVMCGVKGIVAAEIVEENLDVENERGEIKTMQVKCMQVFGVGLGAIMQLPWIDPASVKTNNIPEALSVLGLGAARSIMFSEIIDVLSVNGDNIDPRHVHQLVDTATCTGFIMQYTRHGINRVDNTAFHRASFEEAVQMFANAAMVGENRKMSSVDCVCFGELTPVGTGTVGVIGDPSTRIPIRRHAHKDHNRGSDKVNISQRKSMWLDIESENERALMMELESDTVWKPSTPCADEE